MRYLLILVLALSVIAGCNPSPKDEASPPQNNDNQRNVRVKQTIPAKRDIKDENRNKVALRLAKLANAVPMVKEATCVIIGNTAVVGINVDGNLDRARVGTIKYSVAEALRKDPYGVHAIVTADMDLAQRIREIRRDIDNGRPVAGFAEEMADIIGRIVPQLPKDVLPNNDPPARSEDNQKLKRKSL